MVGGGGRSAIQLVNGTDAVTAAGGGGGADCPAEYFCGGGGEWDYCILRTPLSYLHLHFLLSSSTLLVPERK
jgi:hypothetical protein